MIILYSIASVAFFIWIFRNIIYWVNLWQVKEYRFERVYAHLKETTQGKNLLFSNFSIIKSIAILFYVFVVFNEYSEFPYQLLIASLFIFESFLVFNEIILKTLKRPTFTLKALFLIILAVSSIALLYSIPLIKQGFLWLLILDRSVPFIVSFFVFFLAFPTTLYQDYKIEKASRKMKKNKALVIGITGSYGKSSTKEYLGQILKKRFVVIKTKGSYNTPIGIATTILKELNSKVEVFIVEMGAYKRGEIAQLCQIVNPKIGILTAVSFQHLSLFREPQNVIDTKYELIESLSKSGIAVFNGNNPVSYKLYKRTKINKVLYKVLEPGIKTTDIKSDVDIYAFNVIVSKKSISFDVQINNKILHFKAPLIGGHNVENILPAIYIANYLGINDKEIRQSVENLVSLPQTMSFYKAQNGSSLIDDTFNVNPDGVLAAINYAKIYQGKKIIVLEPMIELGKNSYQEHYRVGKALADNCDYLFLTKNNFYEAIIHAVMDQRGKCLVKVATQKETVDFVLNHTGKDDVVIFEGREANLSLKKILENNLP